MLHTTLLRSSLAAIALSLAAVACAPAATPTPVKAAPTKAATVPTVAPTVKPTQAPTAKPTSAPKPTAAPKPTIAPTVAPTTAPTPQPTVAPLAVGQPQTIGNLILTPDKVQSLTASGTDKPKAGDVFLEVMVTIENNSRTATANFDPATLSLMNPTGPTTFSMLSLKSVSNALKAQTLQPGGKLSGLAVYEVPQTHTGLELIFKTASQSAVWAISG